MNTVTDTNLSSGVSTFTETHFTIESLLKSQDGKILVIAAGHDKKVVAKNKNHGDASQVWVKMPAFLSSVYYYLVNPATNTCVARDSNSQGAHLILTPYTYGMQDELAMWREDTSEKFTAIRNHRDQAQKINIPGNGPYASGVQLVTWGAKKVEDNELWTGLTVAP